MVRISFNTLCCSYDKILKHSFKNGDLIVKKNIFQLERWAGDVISSGAT